MEPHAGAYRLLAADLYGEALTALGATAAQEPSAGRGLHALTETVDALTATVVRLVGAFHSVIHSVGSVEIEGS